MNKIYYFLIILLCMPLVSASEITYGDNYKKTGTQYTIGIPTYQEGGKFQPIDVNLTQSGTSYQSTKNKFKSSFNMDISSNFMFDFEYNGSIFSAKPYSITTDKEYKIKKPIITVTENTISYGEIFDGMTLNYSVNANGIKEDLVLLSKPVTTSDTFIFSTLFDFNGVDAYINGVLWDKHSEKITSSDVEFKKNGISLFKLNKPYAIDAEYRVTDVNYSISKKGSGLVLGIVIPISILNSAVYPVIIDPTITITAGSELSCSIRNGFSTCTTTLWLGNNYQEGVYYYRGLSKWDISSIPVNHNIVSATADLYQSQANANFNSYVKIHQISGTWGSGVNWANQPIVAESYESQNYVPANTNGWYSFDITNMFNSWYTLDNFGFELRDEDAVYVAGNVQSWRMTTDSHMHVSISDELPYPTVIKTNNIEDNIYVLNTTPFFSWINNDTEGDAITNINVQVRDGYGGSGNLLWNYNTASTITSIQYAGSALSQNQLYYVRIKIDDNLSEGVFYDSPFMLNTITCSGVCLENWIFNLKNGAYITIPIINATNFTNTIAGELSFWLNGSFIGWRTGTNKTLTNIQVNNVTDTFSFNGSGTSGYLNITGLMKNATTNYSLFVDEVRYAYAISNSSKYVTFNYSGSWSDHMFVINETIIIPDTNTTPALSSVTNQTCLVSSCVISFDINQSNAITRVRYGNTSAMTLLKTNQTSGFSRTDNLTSLYSNTLYYYTVDAWNVSNQSYYTNSTMQTFTTSIVASLGNATTDNFYIYLNGVFQINTTDPYYNATGLTPNTEYTIGIRSHNNTYNTLGTWVNQSITTNEAPSILDTNTTPALSSVINQTCLTNSCVISFNVNQSNAITRTRYGTTVAMTLLKTNQTSGLSRTDTLSSLSSSTLYYYTVDAWNVSNKTFYTNSTIQTFTTGEAGLGIPKIISFTSDVAGASQYMEVASGTPITYTVTASEASTYDWYVDKKITSTHSDSYIYTPTGYHTISVVARNGYGDSPMEYKNIVISQLTAVVLIPDVNTSDYDTLETIIDNPDLVTIFNFVPSPYTHFMGNTFYLILWALVGLMIWIRSDKITVPTTLGFIIGGAVIGTLPAQYQLISQLIIVSGLFAALFIFFREKK